MVKNHPAVNGVLSCLLSLFLMLSGSAATVAQVLRTNTATAAISSPDQRATYGIQTLQQWYSEDSGLYQKPTEWWNSANAITVLVDYSRATHTTT